MDELIFEGVMPVSSEQTTALEALYDEDDAVDVRITGQDALSALRVEYATKDQRNARMVKINVAGEVHPLEGVTHG